MPGPGWRTLCTAFVMAALLAGCGFPAEDAATPIGKSELPDALTADPTASTAPESRAAATLWFVDDDRLWSVRRAVANPVTAELVVEVLLAGPTTGEQQRGLRSALPTADVVDKVAYDRGAVRVELASTFASIPAPDQLLAVGQLVLTLTDLEGVGAVAFILDGDPVAVPLPSGEATSAPVQREQYATLEG